MPEDDDLDVIERCEPEGVEDVRRGRQHRVGFAFLRNEGAQFREVGLGELRTDGVEPRFREVHRPKRRTTRRRPAGSP